LDQGIKLENYATLNDFILIPEFASKAGIEEVYFTGQSSPDLL